MAADTSSAQFTVGKLDAGMAMLLTDDYQLIEFPSVLLPKDVALGSVVNVSVKRDQDSERRQRAEFRDLQEKILEDFGTNHPQSPVIRVGHVTQTWAMIEWDALDIATAQLRSLHLFRDGQRLSLQLPSTIEAANTKLMAKVSGLDVDHEYEFALEMRTSAGKYLSNTVKVKTHSLENLSGVCVCFGECESLEEIENLKQTVERIGGSWVDRVSPNVTHFVARYASGPEYERTLDLNIPIVKPEWLFACEASNKLQPAIKFYLS